MKRHHPTVTEFFIKPSHDYDFNFSEETVFLKSESPWGEDSLIDTQATGNVLDMSSDYNKVVISSVPGIYHLMFEVVPSIITLVSKFNYHVIFDIKIINNSEDQRRFFKSFLEGISDFLNIKYGQKITVIDSSQYNSVKINNYHIFHRNALRTDIDESRYAISIIKEFLKLNCDNPTKKVYLSRRLVPKNNLEVDKVETDRFSLVDDRVVNEKHLEDFFLRNGFEIVSPETFSSIQEQAEFFSKVETIVSATSSGIANTIFMNKNTNVLELVSPMVVRWFNDDAADETILLLHNQYGPLAYILEQNYARISNENRESLDVIDRIKQSKSIKRFLDMEGI